MIPWNPHVTFVVHKSLIVPPLGRRAVHPHEIQSDLPLLELCQLRQLRVLSLFFENYIMRQIHQHQRRLALLLYSFLYNGSFFWLQHRIYLVQIRLIEGIRLLRSHGFIRLLLPLPCDLLLIGLFLIRPKVAIISHRKLQLTMLRRIHCVFNGLIELYLRPSFCTARHMRTRIPIWHQSSRIIEEMHSFLAEM